MKDKSANQKTGKTAASREDRLKAALKANMAKRKAQSRARQQATAEDSREQDN